MILTLKKLGTEGNHLKPTANNILNGEKLKAVPLRPGTNNQACFASSIQHSTERLRKSNYQEKEMQNWKGRSKNISAHR